MLAELGDRVEEIELGCGDWGAHTNAYALWSLPGKRIEKGVGKTIRQAMDSWA